MENAVNVGPNEIQGLLSVCITRQPPASLSHCLPRASKLPRDQEPFLEMLLNHHNPPQSVCIQSIIGQHHQLHSWQLPALEPNLFKGGAQLGCLCLFEEAFKDSKVQGEGSALN